jgi:hypothetical protein
LESGWDGVVYLQQIIKAVEQIFISPLGCEKVGRDGTIYLMGGESLHPGVREYLSKSMGTDVQSIDELLEANQSLFPGAIMFNYTMRMRFDEICADQRRKKLI